MNVGLFKRVGIRYEVACDILGGMISVHAEFIGIERSKPRPDQLAISQAVDAQSSLRKFRDDLDPRDAAAIEQVIEEFAENTRDLCLANHSVTGISSAGVFDPELSRAKVTP